MASSTDPRDDRFLENVARIETGSLSVKDILCYVKQSSLIDAAKRAIFFYNGLNCDYPDSYFSEIVRSVGEVLEKDRYLTIHKINQDYQNAYNKYINTPFQIPSLLEWAAISSNWNKKTVRTEALDLLQCVNQHNNYDNDRDRLLKPQNSVSPQTAAIPVKPLPAVCYSCENLKYENLTLKERVKSLDTENRILKSKETELVYCFDQSKGSFTIPFREMVYNLLNEKVGSGHVGQVIKTVLSFVNKTTDQLPGQESIRKMNKERLHFLKARRRKCFSHEENATLSSDKRPSNDEIVVDIDIAEEENDVVGSFSDLEDHLSEVNNSSLRWNANSSPPKGVKSAQTQTLDISSFHLSQSQQRNNFSHEQITNSSSEKIEDVKIIAAAKAVDGSGMACLRDSATHSSDVQDISLCMDAEEAPCDEIDNTPDIPACSSDTFPHSALEWNTTSEREFVHLTFKRDWDDQDTWSTDPVLNKMRRCHVLMDKVSLSTGKAMHTNSKNIIAAHKGRKRKYSSKLPPCLHKEEKQSHSPKLLPNPEAEKQDSTELLACPITEIQKHSPKMLRKRECPIRVKSKLLPCVEVEKVKHSPYLIQGRLRGSSKKETSSLNNSHSSKSVMEDFSASPDREKWEQSPKYTSTPDAEKQEPSPKLPKRRGRLPGVKRKPKLKAESPNYSPSQESEHEDHSSSNYSPSPNWELEDYFPNSSPNRKWQTEEHSIKLSTTSVNSENQEQSPQLSTSPNGEPCRLSPKLPRDKGGSPKRRKNKSKGTEKLSQYPNLELLEDVTFAKGAGDCPFCKRIFHCTKWLKVHIKRHEEGRRKAQKCPKCGWVFHTSWAFRKHLDMHMKGNPNVCKVCGQVLTTPSHLKSHMRLHSGEKPFECETCGKTFKTKQTLLQHNNIHTNEWHYLCSHCGNAYQDRGSLIRHIKTRHSGPKPYVCTVCKEGFSYMRELRQHSKTQHKEEGFSCLECNEKFPSKRDLKKHKKKEHVVESTIPCPHCKKVFPDQARLDRHAVVHAEDNPHRCPTCGRGCQNHGALVSHLRTHTNADRPKPVYACSHCNMMFHTVSKLEGHINTQHTGETPFECTECGRKYASRMGLHIHFLIHTRKKSVKCPHCDELFGSVLGVEDHLAALGIKKPYKCLLCEKSFASKGILESHTRLHSGEKPFKCEICGKAYPSRHSLNTHNSLIHSQKGKGESKLTDDGSGKVKVNAGFPQTLDGNQRDEKEVMAETSLAVGGIPGFPPDHEKSVWSFLGLGQVGDIDQDDDGDNSTADR